ncbi:MAG: malonyl-CoA synthase [Candidatus Thiodiazotropha sp. (ex Rostrolucina anterorostrata)]|nr:malonyl-CoA synthase [Candidatus Thiodiazotropha sp. (ex Rostrolucina anterorostrata)]
MSNANLYALFCEHMPSNPEALFLEDIDGRQLYYSEMTTRSGRMLSLLQALGVKKGERVVVQVDKSIEAVLLYLACLRAGAIYIPLNTAYTPAEVAYFLNDALPRLFVCVPTAKEPLSGVAKSCGVTEVLSLGATGDDELMETLNSQPVSEQVVEVEGEDLAAILYTSGTTGRSKGAMLSHANLASNALVLYDFWHWQNDDVLLHALPIFHVHGLFVALHCALLGGSRVIFMPRFDTEVAIRKLPQATVMMGVPTFYTRLLDQQGFTRKSCSGMRLFISGSEPLLAETHRAFEARTGHHILERYGMTEAGMITSNPYHGDRLAGTVGYPLPGVKARVADDKGKELPRGETGVLEITGPNVFKGYWQMPEKSAEEFRDDGWFITGDIAVMTDDDRITIVGRAKDLIISGGFNVYPKEIESEIDELTGVKESAVIGLSHPDFGEGVTAVVVTDGSSELNEETIIAALSSRLAKFKRPKRVFIVDKLPRNTMGKVQKNVLRENYRELFK